MPNLAPAMPEIFVAVMACVALMVGVFTKTAARWLVPWLVYLALAGAGFLTLDFYGHATQVAFSGMFVLDTLAIVLKVFILLASFVALLYSPYYLQDRKMPTTEYFVLALFSVLGMMIIVSARNLLTLYMGLELFSLPVYAMVALRRESSICSEAAMKYFVVGALASGILLYGMSMLYGATKSLDIPTIANVINQTAHSHQLIMVFGLVFIMVGIAFKLGAVPFHMWIPDVYHGAPSTVTLFISSAPKIAGLGMAFRLLVGAMPGLHVQWQEMLIVLAILSMAIGNLVAISQTNIKRMLAYSSIAHVGYMTLGLLVATPKGYAAALFYMITYSIMTLGAFGMVVLMSRAGVEAENIDDFKGLNSRNPWLAFMMLLLMFSMAGVPPIVGFMAKVSVLEALISGGFVWLAALALLFAIVGAYYYIRVVKVMYFEEPTETTPVVCETDIRIIASANGLAVLALGLFPGALFHICQTAF